MKANSSIGWLLLAAGLWVVGAGCADRSPSPPSGESFSDEDQDSGDAAVETAKPPAASDSTAPSGAPVPKADKPPPVLAEGANPRVVEARGHLEAERFEDLLGVFEASDAAKLTKGDRASLAEIYFQAAERLHHKRRDIAFSSLMCERGLLVAPQHQGLIRLQIYNYLHPDMKLVSGAEELAVQLVKQDPEDLENQLLRGKVAFEQGDFDTAVDWLKKAARVGRAQKGPMIDEAWKLLDLAKGKQEEIKSALSMTRELEVMLKRAKNQAHAAAVTKPAGEGEEGAVLAGGEALEPGGGSVVLYMTRWCKYCRQTAELLKRLNVKFEQKDIERDQKALMELMQLAETNGVNVNGVPVVRVGDKLVVGYNPELIESLVSKIK